jgi:DNA-binding LytR/AlgR family response regulator
MASASRALQTAGIPAVVFVTAHDEYAIARSKSTPSTTR